MNLNARIDRVIERFCIRLGRYGSWSKLLDGFAPLICPSYENPLLMPAAVGNLSPLARPIFMSGVTSGQGGRYDTSRATDPSTRPNGGDKDDPPHSGPECTPVIFHGMHGAPCKFHGGSDDNKFCPPGSITGLWWRFNIPGVGNIYYVDCCGLDINWKVWCRWAKEVNWCAGRGNNKYVCTLTLLHGELHRDGDGFADPAYHVLSGPASP